MRSISIQQQALRFGRFGILAAALNLFVPVRAADVEVRMTNTSFSPATARIKVGDSITWRNFDFVSHTSTSGTACSPDGQWGSDFLTQNQTFSHTFNTAGTFPYYCIPHCPFMVGSVIVEEATAPASISITQPANGAVLPPNPVAITAEASAGANIVMVEFYDGETFLQMDHDVPFSVTANLTPGTHTLTARATPASGSILTSAPVSITINSPLPGGERITNALPPLVKGDTTVELQLIADGLVSPLGLATPDDGTGRLFVYDQVGKVFVVTNRTRLDTPLLDVTSRLVSLNPAYDERGLIGLATHPQFKDHPLIYTYTSEPIGPMADFMNLDGTNDHQSVLAEWKIDATDPNRVDPASRREILRVDKPQFNHNGGTIHFGPDGLLYIALGDGGAADDQGPGHSEGGNGQDLNKILGKLIRIDVDARTSPNGQYGVPTDNPFVGKDGLDEIYALGFRNPYSWSFDRLTGEIYVGDVGQNDIEEIDRVFKGGNYGWPIKEGSFYFDPAGTNNGFIVTIPVRDVPADLVDPIGQYDHGEGIAIVGGYMYHGSKLPGLLGRYITGDLGNFGSGSGRLFYLDRAEVKELVIGIDNRKLNGYLKGFGQDQAGELYVAVSTNIGPGGTDGRVYKLVPPTNSLALTVTASGTNIGLTWTGGTGPFVVQEREDLDENTWGTVAATATRSFTLPAYDKANFLRVADMAGNGAIPFTVAMSAAAERPQTNNSTGTGFGTLSLEGNTLHFDIRYAGLTGPAILAHIHGPANAAEATNVLINLAPFNGGAFGTNGTLSGSVTLTPDQKAALLKGKTCVNVHTDLNRGGEIRGQIAPVTFTAELSGDAERPAPVDEAGGGSGIFMLIGNQLTFDMEYHSLSSSAVMAHIHGPADEDEAANVMVPLNSLNEGAFGTNGTLGGTVTLTPDQLAASVDGLTYVNVHTEKHGTGEIRGQLRPNTTAIPLTASLSPSAERGNIVTNSSASGTGSFVLEGNFLRFNVRYGGLTGAAVLAHIHGPSTAAEATNVMLNLAPFNGGAFGTNGTLSGRVTVTDEQRAAFLEGRTYVNVHTPANPNGEIRGQILPVAMHAVLSGAAERPASVQTGGHAHSTFLLVGNQLTICATYSGLSTNAIAAHIHGPSTTANSGNIMVNMVGLSGGSFSTNGSFSGSVTLTPDQIAALADRLTYLNVHSQNNPGGEIRGQITR